MYSRVIQLYIDIYFRFFSIIGYYKIFSTVPCAIQWVLVYFVYGGVYMLIPIPNLSPLITFFLWIYASVSIGQVMNRITGLKGMHILHFNRQYSIAHQKTEYFQQQCVRAHISPYLCQQLISIRQGIPLVVQWIRICLPVQGT